MSVKFISLKSKNAIVLDKPLLLKRVNDLREEHGEGKKSPITIEKMLLATNVLLGRTETNGSISLSLHYLDDDGISCVRNFPNLGLEVTSNSSIRESSGDVIVDIDVSLKAGKKKWHLDEIRECEKILASNEYGVTLSYCCDEATDAAGYCVRLALKNGDIKDFGTTFLTAKDFTCSFSL